MTISSLLHDLGLTTYEADAYERLLSVTVTDANSLAGKANIPMGKIYEVLSTLHNKGLIEVQDGRPKRYRVKRPKQAFQQLLDKKQEEAEHDLARFRDVVGQLEDVAPKGGTISSKNVFWTTVVGNEVVSFAQDIFDEAEHEIIKVFSEEKSNDSECARIAPMIFKLSLKALRKGVKIKIIESRKEIPGFIEQAKQMEEVDAASAKLLDTVEAKTHASDMNFMVIDRKLVAIMIYHPLKPKEVYGVVKIYDQGLAESLHKKFTTMWRIAR